MRTFAFAKRCAKEVLRDPLNIMFGIGFPLVLLFLLSAIQANIPVDMFEIKSLAPGIAVFGLSFISLFSATLVAKDRESSFLRRLYTTPLRSVDFILGYMLPLIPMALAQSAVCYFAAVFLGLPPEINILYAVIMILPVSVFYISFGLLCGSIFSVKQVGGICGALLTNLSAWLSGIWFDIELVGVIFEKIADVLPFVHSVEIERAIISGNFSGIIPHFYYVAIYAALAAVSAVIIFLRQMKKQ